MEGTPKREEPVAISVRINSIKAVSALAQTNTCVRSRCAFPNAPNSVLWSKREELYVCEKRNIIRQCKMRVLLLLCLCVCTLTVWAQGILENDDYDNTAAVNPDVLVQHFPKSTRGLRRQKRAWIIPPTQYPENDRGPFPKPMVQAAAANPGVVVLHFPKSTRGLRRQKRAWVIPPINYPENDRGPFPKTMVQVRSDGGDKMLMLYSITGPGADQPPVGIFTVDTNTGWLSATQSLDREKKPFYMLQVHAVYAHSGNIGNLGEEPMDINVVVIDMNDNRPLFTKDTYLGQVPEASPLGFVVCTVNATDADEPGNDNSDVRYVILNQEPKTPADNLFAINPVSGAIGVNAGGLDREQFPKYTLDVQAADMRGEGLTKKTQVILTVTGSNDNAPVFQKATYEATVPENEVGAVVVKMTVTDGDEPRSPAWNAKFTIVEGDPTGLFTVETSPVNKQEGIIKTAKGLDFESNNKYKLLVAVENEAPFATRLPTATATVTVTVVDDVNEKPSFSEDELFLRSLLPSIQRLPPQQKKYVKFQIHKLIYEAITGVLNLKPAE